MIKLLNTIKIKRKGDTLVEVTIALAILTLLLTTAVTAAIRSYKIADLARERTVAYNIAQSQADTLRTYRKSMSWEVFSSENNTVNVDGKNVETIGRYVTCPPNACAYPSVPVAGGANKPLSASDPDDSQVISDALDDYDPTSTLEDTVDVGRNVFYFSLFDVDNSPNFGTQWSPISGALIARNGQYLVTITPNWENTSGSTGPPSGSRDLMRFDIRVQWRSRLGTETFEEASLVVLLTRTEGNLE